VRKTETALAIGEASASETPDADMPPEFKATLRKIRDLLREAWTSLDDIKDRKRVVKRLLLQWHPDKNPPANKDYCTRMTQAILSYVKLLDQGLPLPEDDTDEYRDRRDMGDWFNYPGSNFSSAFYNNMYSRGCRHGRDYAESQRSSGRGRRGGRSRGGGGGGGGGPYVPNTQPGEGRRWMRQALADIDFARGAMATHEKGHNWICYLCHQVSMALLLVCCERACAFSVRLSFYIVIHYYPSRF
jgi:sacsin